MTTDTELLQRYLRSRSEEAFATLVRRHIDLVYSAALRRVGNDAQLAEDVTQEVFAELARQGEKLLDRPTLGSWLYTTSRYKAIDVVRKESRRRSREMESLSMKSEYTDGPSASDWENVRPVIDEAMDALSKGDQQILILRFFENRSFADAAELLATTEDAARMRSQRALEHLRAVLAKRGVTSATEVLALILANKAVGAAPGYLAANVTVTALASAKAGATSASNLMHFMTTAKFAVGAATLALLLGSAATALYEAKSNRRATNALALTRQQMSEDQSRLSDVVRQQKAAERRTAELQASIDSAAATLAAQSTPVDARAAGRTLLARHPDASTLVVGHEMAYDAQRYAPLFSALGLSPEQQKQVLELMARRSDLGLSWFTNDGTPAGEIGTGVNDLSADQVQAQLRALLGTAQYQKYVDFDRGIGAQNLVQQLAGNLYATGAPITQAQANQLVQVLAQSSADYQAGKGMWGAQQINWDVALANAQPILADAQLAALKNLRQASAYQDALGVAERQEEDAAMTAAQAAAGKSQP